MVVLHPKTVPAERSEIQRHPRRRMTEEEFVEWIDEKTRAEWVDGKVEMMSPVNSEHDVLVWWFRTLVQLYVESCDLGVVHGPEFMTRLSRRRRLADILFVSKARTNIVGENHVDGPPDLIVEVVSPESPARDYRDKFNDYEAAGVKEYWILDPGASRVAAYHLSRSRKYRLIEEADDGIHSAVLAGFRVRPEWVFAKPRPSVLKILSELGIRGA
jgi:Uma2 family endonuclease